MTPGALLLRLLAATDDSEWRALVTAAIEGRHASVMRDHAEWLAAHDKAMAEMWKRGKALDARIDCLLSAIDELRRQGNGGSDATD